MSMSKKSVATLVACVLGAAVMIGCGGDDSADMTSGDADTTDVPVTTEPETTTTSTSTTTSTTVAPTTEAPTTVASTTSSSTTKAPTTKAPSSTAAPATVGSTTSSTTSSSTTSSSTTTTTTLPPLDLYLMWSGSSTGCPAATNLFLDASTLGFNGPATITATVSGQSVGAYGGNTYNIGIPVLFDQWPTITPNGTFTVTVTASAAGYRNSSLTTSVTYNCP